MKNKTVKIVKFPDPDKPGHWYLTDFTMEQVEGRLNYLENENAALRKELSELKENRKEVIRTIAKGVKE